MASQHRFVAVFASLLVFATFVLYETSSWTPLARVDELAIEKDRFRAPQANPWTELSKKEADDIYTWLYDECPYLNLTATPRTGLENHINFIETLRPNKTDTLDYLVDHTAAPQRWAKAAITQTVEGQSFVFYYMIGPLPVSSETELLPLDWAFSSGHNYIKNPVPSYQRLLQYGSQLASNVSDITWELIGAGVKTEDEGAPVDPNSLNIAMRPVWVKNGTIEFWMTFERPGPHSGARSILPQALFVKIQTSNNVGMGWQIMQWYYNGISYATADGLRLAMRKSGFSKAPPNMDGSWTEIEDYDSDPPGRDIAPPVMIQPQGPRYQLDKKERYVSWMGFTFHMASSQATGPAIFDIRFKGDRVMYELGLQEAMAHYAGDDPVQGGQEFMDSFFGMGKYAFELVRGYDCPAYADYLDSTYHIAGQPWTNPSSICIFEYTADHLLQRHTSQYQVSVSKQNYLIIRSVSTVGNYDYTIDYIFYLDGTIEVKIRASGFIFAAFYSADTFGKEDKYGYRVHDAVATSMHDHVINFKADIDVAGSSNDFVRVAVEPTQRSYPWEQPEIPLRNTMVLNEYPLMTESGLDWPKNGGQFYTIYHANKTNKWGERRGYRITPGTGMGTPPHLTILNSTTLGKSARWSEHDVWVLRNKDTEPASADPFNYLNPNDPILDFTQLANGESLQHDDEYDGDLVLYFNLGAHHVPHSGDIPNTLMHTSASSVMFVPHNFNDRDPSRATVQGVRLGLSGKNGAHWLSESSAGAGDLRSSMRIRNEDVEAKKATPHYFGGTYDSGVKIPKEDLQPDLTQYGTAENDVTDLGFNGSIIGAWYRDVA